MTKKRSMDELRQTKEYRQNPWELYGPQIGSSGEVNLVDITSTATSIKIDNDNLLARLQELRKQYPNNQEFGTQVAAQLLLL